MEAHEQKCIYKSRRMVSNPPDGIVADATLTRRTLFEVLSAVRRFPSLIPPARDLKSENSGGGVGSYSKSTHHHTYTLYQLLLMLLLNPT